MASFNKLKGYPRPQMVRHNWTDLDGTWDFIFDDEDQGEKERWSEAFPRDNRQITVPFSYETVMSGIHDETRHDHVWYHRTVSINIIPEDHREILHLEGSDFHTKVFVNGDMVGEHDGGYTRFGFDITDNLGAGENDITIKVDDSPSLDQPRGKQRWKSENFACWYVQTTGIWKSVWMEEVPALHIEKLKITPSFAGKNVRIDYVVAGAEICSENSDFQTGRTVSADNETTSNDITIDTVISFDGKEVNRSSVKSDSGKCTDIISVSNSEHEQSALNLHPWTPEQPDLYDLTVILKRNGVPIDEVKSYFGLRDVAIADGKVLLNGAPIYQRLILDQGYWKESGLTPPSEEALVEDIDKIHQLGFNGLRKHMKIEDERFLYWCDVKGMLVWSEMPATFRFDDTAIEEFMGEWADAVNQNYNHPCIITWTPFNESWGISDVKTCFAEQQFTEAVYHLTKSIDQMRPVIVNDGWEHTVSDLLTLHDYEEDGDAFEKRYRDKEKIVTNEIYHCKNKCAMADGYKYKGQPVIISEYGGIAFAGGGKDDWGYGNTVSSKEEFLKRFDRITSAIKNTPHIVGYCYTQVTDVQQEINGLMDMDRNFKVDPKKIYEINMK